MTRPSQPSPPYSQHKPTSRAARSRAVQGAIVGKGEGIGACAWLNLEVVSAYFLAQYAGHFFGQLALYY